MAGRVLDPLDHPHADLLASALAASSNRRPMRSWCSTGWPTRPGRSAGRGDPRPCRRRGGLLVGVFTVDDLDVPAGVRRIDGSAGRDGVVVDRPWLVGVTEPSSAVLCGLPVDADAAELLADILDIGLASERQRADVVGEGTAATWDDGAAVAFAAATGRVRRATARSGCTSGCGYACATPAPSTPWRGGSTTAVSPIYRPQRGLVGGSVSQSRPT